MKKEEVLNALREEEERRRKNAKRREKEILALMEEQNLDMRGKLWGENSFSAMAEKEETKWDGDVIARICPDFNRDPEKIAIRNEVARICDKTIQSAWGESGLELFVDWLFRTTVAEMAEERDVPFTMLLNQIKAMVAECRQRVGVADPALFPFEEHNFNGKTARRINCRRGYSRIMKGQSIPADEASRIYLSEAEKALSLDVLWELLKSKGHSLSRTTAHRAKSRGWFLPSEWLKSGRRQTGERVCLTPEEQTLPWTALMERFGFSNKTAQRAKARGYFEANSTNRHLIRIPANRNRLPSVGGGLPAKISEDPAGKKISQMEISEIMETFGLSKGRACKVRQRGFISTRKWPIQKRLDLARRLGIGESAPVAAILDFSIFEVRMKVRAQLASRTQTWKDKDGFVMVQCGLCGQPLHLGEATIDHIIPKGRGGGDELSNLQLAHESCNNEKGDRVSPIRVAFEKARQSEN